MGLSCFLDRNEKNCISILQHPTLTQMKRERMMIDYYHTVIGNSNSLTVKDVRMINRTFQLGMKICEQYYPSSSQNHTHNSVAPINISMYTEN